MAKKYFEQLTTYQQIYHLPHGSVLTQVKHLLPPGDVVSKKDIQACLSRIIDFLSALQRLSYEIEQDVDLQPASKKLLQRTIAYLEKECDLFHISMYLQADEKGFPLSDEKRQVYQARINDIQTDLYGPSISSVERERKRVVSTFAQLFDHKQNLLHEDQKRLFKHFLDHFYDDIQSIEYIHEHDTTPGLTRDEYKHVLELGLHFHDLTDYTIVFVDGQKNISLSAESKELRIPTLSTYDHISVKRLCQLLDHELGLHGRRNAGMHRYIGAKNGNYLKLEEGMAMFMEHMVSHNIDEIDFVPTEHHLRTFLAEQYDGETTYALLTCYYTMIEHHFPQDKALHMTERAKRFNSWYLPGANRKDAMYTRGFREVLSYVKEEQDRDTMYHLFQLLFLGKFGEDELRDGTIMEYIQEQGIDIHTLEKPFRLGQYLYRTFTGKGYSQDLLVQEYLGYTDKKRLIESNKIAIAQEAYAILISKKAV